jgi:hypothetical protein
MRRKGTQTDNEMSAGVRIPDLMHRRVGERGPSCMEVFQRGTAVPRVGGLARGISTARARRRHERVCERDLCETGAGPTWTPCVGTQVMGVASTQKPVGCRIVVDEYLTGTMACMIHQSF